MFFKDLFVARVRFYCVHHGGKVDVLYVGFIPGKPRGLRTGRKLRLHRRDQKWHDKAYKKAHLGTALKANPFGGASHAKGIVLEKV